MSMLSSGGGATYSVYEENNYRSSFAASDSDIVAGTSNHPNNSHLDVINGNMSNYTNENLIYSTNFNNKSTTSSKIPNYSLNEFHGSNGISVSGGHTAVPIILTAHETLDGGSSASSSSMLSSVSNNNSQSKSLAQKSQMENYMNHQVDAAGSVHNYVALNGKSSFSSNGFNNYSNYYGRNSNGSSGFDVKF